MSHHGITHKRIIHIVHEVSSVFNLILMTIDDEFIKRAGDDGQLSLCQRIGIYSDKNNRKLRDFQTKAFAPNVTYDLYFSGSRIPQFSDDGQRLYLIYLPPNTGHLYGH